MKYLVTGSAGFIGSTICLKLLKLGHSVVGIDNLNNYYDVELKKARLNLMDSFSNFKFLEKDITDVQSILSLFINENFNIVIHLAAQAGVRYSLENPFAYADSNLKGHLSILEGCRQTKVKHLVYASSSSVYGVTDKAPFTTDMPTDHPISLYAATKKANELMAHS
ncbi:GDP-mannose 4,6-dehydratase, partial [Providencia rettgeri]|nr:GDP-mannose 4,6-dehydratase [Providencia rettgeri]